MRPQLPTWVLTERVPRRCRLRPADAAYLLAEHRPRLQLLPTPRRHVYRVTATGCVGVLTAPYCRLLIRPKIPLANLFYLLDADTPPASPPDCAAASPGTEALQFLAGRLINLLRERLTVGLHRGYGEHAEHGPRLHGRLDVAAQVREPPGRKDRLHSRFDDLTPDVPCNQVVRSIVERLLACPLLAEPAAAALRSLLPHLDGVRPVPLTPAAFDAARADRRAADYGPLLDVCRLLADSLTPNLDAGNVAVPGFLLDLGHVFERCVTRCVREAFAERAAFAVAAQPSCTVSEPATVQMRPDVLVQSEGRSVLVVDAKWKRLRDGLPESADLYQMLAYGTALATNRVALVYPGRHNRRWSYAFAHSAIRLDVLTLRVVGTHGRCVAARRALARLMAALAGGA